MEIYVVRFWEVGEPAHERVFNNFDKASAFYNDMYCDGFWNIRIDLCDFVEGELKSVHLMGSYFP